MKKKLVPMLLIVAIVFNFILCIASYADLDDKRLNDLSRYGGNDTIKGEAAQSLVDNGTDSSGTTMEHTNFGISFTGMIFQTLALIANSFPMTVQGLLSVLATNPAGPNESDFLNSVFAVIGDIKNHFTIERTVFNEVAIFNIDVFNQGESYTNGSGSHTETIYQQNLNLKLKEHVTGWYYTVRLLASMINLCILIYIGIKMAISSAASEEAKYKMMLIWWAESMIMLFMLQYIMYIIIFLGNVLLNIINAIRYDLIANQAAISFEDKIITRIYRAFAIEGGSRLFLYSIFFWFLTAMHIKFFLTYMKRTFTVFFLVVISPLITVTFPIDKLDNGKAEAFEKWLKEFIINVIIQPIHAIVYLVFVYTAGKIAEEAPIVAMIFLLSIGRIENIIRNIFQITDSVENVNSAFKNEGKGPGLIGIAKMFKGKNK